MFSIQMERSRSDSSTSSISSALSLSPCGWNPRAAALSPPTTTTTPLSGSPELHNTKFRTWQQQQHCHPMKRSLTAPSPVAHETFCPSSGRGAFGYPCWPAGESLSAGSSPSVPRSSPTSSPISPTSSASYTSFQPPTSHISDDDLEQLDFTSVPSSQQSSLAVVDEVPVGGPNASEVGISWSQVGALAAEQEQQPQQSERRRRLPPPPPGMAMGDSRRRKRVPSRSSSRGGTTRRCVSQPPA